MQLRAEILKEHSKAQADKIARWVGTNAERFSELISLFLNDEQRVVQRAAYALSKIVDHQPEMVQPYLDELVVKMAEPGQHVAVRRNIVRVLQFLELPEHLHGQVVSHCFDFLCDPKEAIAVRAFSMTVLANLSRTYPDIQQELKTVIEEQLALEPPPGLASRGKKVLAALKRQKH